MTVSSWSWLVLVTRESWRGGRVVKRDGMDASVGMLIVVVVGSGNGVFLMRRVEDSPRCSVVAARVLCGNRILRRDFPDAATIGMGSLIFFFL